MVKPRTETAVETFVTTNSPARILIVDDHPVVRRGLAQVIADESDLLYCGEAADAGEALRQIDATSPDLVVVDISLRSGHGIELIKQIKARESRVKMIVWSMHDDSLYAERALRAGAMGYINKQESIDHVVDAIRQVLKGKVYLSTHMTDHMLRRVVNVNEAPDQLPVDRLSDRELEVFELIGQGQTTRNIATKLHLSIKTIETYRENIKAKLNLENGSELSRHAVQWVLENGT